MAAKTRWLPRGQVPGDLRLQTRDLKPRAAPNRSPLPGAQGANTREAEISLSPCYRGRATLMWSE